jgi:hypothetical protein
MPVSHREGLSDFDVTTQTVRTVPLASASITALSMIIGLEYPIAGIRRDTLEQVRNTLAGIAAEIQLQEGPAPDLSVRSIGSNKGN